MDQEARDYIAARLREELKRQRYPHQAAADQLGIDRSAVSLKLRGERRFSAEELVVLARWLNVPVAQFMPQTVDGDDVEPMAPLQWRRRGLAEVDVAS